MANLDSSEPLRLTAGRMALFEVRKEAFEGDLLLWVAARL